MSGNSTLDPRNFPNSEGHHSLLKGHDEAALGPSDSSDSGSDVAGEGLGDDDSDRNGTGERATVGRRRRTRTDADLDTDRVINADEAGLAGDDDSAEAPGTEESTER